MILLIVILSFNFLEDRCAMYHKLHKYLIFGLRFPILVMWFMYCCFYTGIRCKYLSSIQLNCRDVGINAKMRHLWIWWQSNFLCSDKYSHSQHFWAERSNCWLVLRYYLRTIIFNLSINHFLKGFRPSIFGQFQNKAHNLNILAAQIRA